MPTNPYVNWWSDKNEQLLLHELMTEAIQFHGLDVYYLPRTMRREDTLYNEDVLSQFTSVFPIEVYLKNVAGWDGQGNFLNKFGLNIEHTFTVMISVVRFNEIVPSARMVGGRVSGSHSSAELSGIGTHFGDDLRVGEQIMTQTTRQVRTVMSVANNERLTMNGAFDTAVVSEFYVIVPPPNPFPIPSRPMEGDWIYIPLPIDKMFEIKFVENEKAPGQFYPLGTKTFYEVSLETFTYSHEEVRTGDPAVDFVETEHAYSQDLVVSLGGSGDYILGETVYQGATAEAPAATGVVALWDANNTVLRLTDITGVFANAIPVIGMTSLASRGLGVEVCPLLIPTDPLNDNRYLADADDEFLDTREGDPFADPFLKGSAKC